MINIEGIKKGNFLELWSEAKDTMFANGNKELKDSFSEIGVRFFHDFCTVNSINENKWF